MIQSETVSTAKKPLPTPPEVKGGLPWLGNMFEFYRDQEGLFRRGYQEHGELFAIRLMGQPMAIMVGKEQHEFFFKQTDKVLDMEKPYEFLAAMFGKIAFLGPHEQYMLHRPVLHSLFGREQMAGYLPVMSRVVQSWLDGLGDEGHIDISAEMVNLVKEVAGRCFLGDAVHERLLEDGFWKHYDALSASLDPILYNWPLPKFRRRDQARASIHRILQPLIEERRRQPVADGFQHLLDQPDGSGQPLENEVIANIFSALMFAGHETTAGQAAWSVIQLAEAAQVQAQVIAEAEQALDGGREIDHVKLRDLKVTAAAVQESGRMHPSAETLFREVTEDVEVKGYGIPKGWFMMTSTAAAHFIPEAYAQPFDYNPQRFLEGGEGKGFDFISFGGGIHKCTGMNFASAEMAIIVGLLFTQFDVDLVTPYDEIKVERSGSSKPGPAILHYKRKSGEQ